jgi:hypothetical protein
MEARENTPTPFARANNRSLAGQPEPDPLLFVIRRGFGGRMGLLATEPCHGGKTERKSGMAWCGVRTL